MSRVTDARGDVIEFDHGGNTKNLGPDPRIAKLTGTAKIAYDLARKGYRVHPLAANEKVPILDDWPNNASSSIAFVLDTFFEKDFNVGIACGHDITVLDADCAAGLEALAALNLPANTPIGRTPSGWSHAYLRTPPDVVLGNRAKMYVPVNGVGKPLDVRGAGGQVVAPGCSAWSRHKGAEPVFGPYICELPPIADVPTMPPHVVALIGLAAERLKKEWVDGTCGDWRAKISPKLWERICEDRPVGQRSEHSFSVFLSLFDLGLTDDDAQEVAEHDEANFANKFRDTDRLDYEISNVRHEWRKKQIANDPLQHFDAVQSAPGMAPPKPAPKATSWRDDAYTAAQLQKLNLPPLRWCLDGLLPEGLVILAAPPKAGKSWMVLDIALAVSTGAEALGRAAGLAGDVLYLALEDNKRRMQDRISAMGVKDWPARMTVIHRWRTVDKGGLADIREWLKDAKNPRLVVVDILKKVRPAQRQPGRTSPHV